MKKSHVKLQNACQVRQEMIVKSIIEKSGRIIALRRLYGILLIRRYVRLSIMKNARRMLLHVDHGKWLFYTIMREKRFAELQRTQARRNQSHYLDLLAGIINADLRDDDFNQMSMLPEKPSDQEAMKQQLLKLLYTLVDSLDELKRHVLILFNANYETGLTAIRAVTVNRMLTVIEQANWSRYIDLNNVAVVETVDEENSNFDTPDMGIKLTKKKVAGLKKWDESAEG